MIIRYRIKKSLSIIVKSLLLLAIFAFNIGFLDAFKYMQEDRNITQSISNTIIVKSGKRMSTVSGTENWWMSGHDTKNSRRTTAYGPQKSIIKWSKNSKFCNLSSPVIGSDGNIYIVNSKGILHAFNEKGDEVWTLDVEEAATPVISPNTTILLANTALYFIDPSGSLNYKKNYYDKKLVYFSIPMIDDNGYIYVHCSDNIFIAFTPSGSIRWKLPIGLKSRYSPSIGIDGSIYVASNSLTSISKNGKIRWSNPIECYSSSPAVASDGTIYVGSIDSNLYAVNSDGSNKWSFKTGKSIVTCPAIGINDNVYFGSDDTYVYAVNKLGKLQWKFKANGLITSSPVIDGNGACYFYCNDRKLYAIKDGKLQWSMNLSSISDNPAIGYDGTLYFACNDGKFYAVAGK